MSGPASWNKSPGRSPWRRVTSPCNSVKQDQLRHSVVVEQWQRHYNHIGPHSSLAYQTPFEFKLRYDSPNAGPFPSYEQADKSRQVRASKSGRELCNDNAAPESFFATLKKELVHLHRFSTREEAKRAKFEYMELSSIEFDVIRNLATLRLPSSREGTTRFKWQPAAGALSQLRNRALSSTFGDRIYRLI